MDITRRHFFSRTSTGIGIAALGSLLSQDGFAATGTGGLPGLPHFAPKAKRVVFLHQSGGPSQMDLFDYKPTLNKFAGTELPGSGKLLPFGIAHQSLSTRPLNPNSPRSRSVSR